ncbi:nickel ABC transporter substrate-binding protein [Staphylococcus simiae]|uniref:ABC transporter, substrate-binding protein n=1 Tax=Staphylococcus simiae CCM 7213 = CCUG 51256 TaxID=911238 RepID=G5JH20_9STAP|nr:nickel ABC transporter substrate-binding protein [Staphylococcus simiae]EHJ08507.1 ABC transporter, substrate-binding protein [Staphylococcus simiae CCM 7213 = CCUG 51256]PNZ09543.1 nickel ABC transporter substrate-binding protein [Staphylococcus simiae]SNV58398.1 ABC superfamily ATP binding cassette transporter, binding protein [Staphylococcus simiae]
MKFLRFATVLAASTLALTACGSSHSSDKDLNVSLPLKTKSIAPYETDVPVKIGAAESLFKTDKNGDIKKVLVKSYKQPNPNTLDIELKDNIKFQNGHKLTAEKVKNSLENSINKSDLVKYSLPIKDISAKGQHLTITTKEAYPELVSELANPFMAIYDTDAKTDVNKEPIGTGPYQIKDYKQSQKISLSKYDHYWQGQPKLNHITVTYQEDGNNRVRNLESNKVDLITDVPVDKVKDIDHNSDLKTTKESGFRTSLLMYNQTSDKMTQNTRQALDKLIDRKGIAEHIYQGYAKPATGPFNDKLKFIKEPSLSSQDINEAKKLLAKEGYSAKHPLKIRLVTYDGRPELPKIAQVLQSDAKKANVDIDIKKVDDIEGYLKDKSQWDATMYSFGTIPRGDTGYFFNQAYKKDGAINKGDYHNDKVAALIDKLNTTVDKNERHQISNEIIKQSTKDIPSSYIAYNDQIVAAHKNVKNYQVTPEGIYLIDYKTTKEK